MSDAGRHALEQLLGHRFSDPDLLETALTHPSRAHEIDGTDHNERLEFLGDAVLDLVVARSLYDAQPGWSEGDLTLARAALVNTRELAARSRALGLQHHVRLGRTELRTGGFDKDSILGNLFEAIVAALYLDGGLVPVTRLVRRSFEDQLASAAATLERDAKTRFQEWAHAHFKQTPTYRALADSGDDADAARFTVEVSVGGEAFGRGVARTKRQAEQQAAQRALVHADREPPSP